MDASSPAIRQARASDAPRIHELHTISVRALCCGHYASGVIDGWLANRQPDGYLPPIQRGDLFVAEREKRVIGFGEAVAGTIVAVYVDPSAVNHGVGTAIIRHAIEKARLGHSGPIRVESTLNAVPFYERFGFRELARSSVDRGRVAVPVVVMERNDT